MRLRLEGLLLLLCLSACGGEPAHEGHPLGAREQAIVYGEDDRVEVYEHPDRELRQLARASVLGLIPRSRLQRPVTGEVRLAAPLLGDAYDLCAEERFVEQPVAADCSGVLIDTDLVLTAGHCFQDVECTDYFYVFDYFYRAKGQLEPIGANDIYTCQSIVTQQLRLTRTGQQVDYAVIQLDRPVSGRLPVPVRTTPLVDGEPLSVAGTGSGLPIKLDSGASVLKARTAQGDFFSLEGDTFEGSSGSGIFDVDGQLVGVLVRGGDDYVEDIEADCWRVNRRAVAVDGTLPDGDLGHEQATYVSHAIEGLCAEGFPSEALCGISTLCGDGVCSEGETRESCVLDCDPCLDGVCGARADVRFAAGEAVEQQKRARSEPHGGCSLGSSKTLADSGAPWALAVLAGLSLRRRRS